MLPDFKEGDRVITYNFSKIKEKDVIILNKSHSNIIKRIKKISNNKYYVLGDNLEQSTDSRGFGWVTKKDIKCKVLFKY